MIHNTLTTKTSIISSKIKIAGIGIVALIFAVISFFGLSKTAFAAPTVEIWWPSANAELHATQPFKGLLQGYQLNQYTIYWQVDGGNMVAMGDSNQDYPHKEATVDLSGWNWKGTGPYVLTFTAKDQNGQVIGQTTRTIYTGPVPTTQAAVSTPAPVQTPVVTASAPALTAVVVSPTVVPKTISPSSAVSIQPKVSPVATPSVAPTVVTSTQMVQVAPVVAAPSVSSNSSNPLAGKKLYVDPNTQAAAEAKNLQSSNPTNAALLKKIADSPVATWLGNWYNDSQTQQKVSTVVSNAKAQGSIPTFVLYNIPIRDCGSYSAGGANNPDGYKVWVNTVANAIGNNNAVVVLEPDALAQISCLSSADQATRIDLLKNAVSVLKAKAGVSVYIDAGHAGWISADNMANSLKQAGIAQADGFSLNVSNFQSSSENASYGKDISSKTGGKHFIVDTSRNGNGSNGEWCNPNGRALGAAPTTQTNDPLIDAYLWVKAPGESDGTCNGGPSAGTWWTSYALGLATLAKI